MKSFNIATDDNGQSSFSIPFSDYINVHILNAGVAESVTLPAGAKFVIFSSTFDFFARINTTASIPSNDVADGSGSELNPIVRSLVGVSSLSIVSPADCVVTMSFYS